MKETLATYPQYQSDGIEFEETEGIEFVDFNTRQKTLNDAIEFKINEIDSKYQEPNALLPMGGGAFAIPLKKSKQKNSIESDSIEFQTKEQARPRLEKISRYLYGDETINQIKSNVANGGWFDPTNMFLNFLEVTESAAKSASNLVWGAVNGITFGASDLLEVEEKINKVAMIALKMDGTKQEPEKIHKLARGAGDIVGSIMMYQKLVPSVVAKLGGTARIAANASKFEKALGLGSLFAAGRTVEEISKRASGNDSYKGSIGVMESFMAGVLTSAAFQTIGAGLRGAKTGLTKLAELYQERHLAGLMGISRVDMKLMKPDSLSTLIDKARAAGKFNDIDNSIALRTFNKYEKIARDKTTKVITGETPFDGQALSELFQIPNIKYSKSLSAVKLRDALKKTNKVQGDFTKDQLRVIEKVFSGDKALTATEVSRNAETILDTFKYMRASKVGEVSRLYDVLVNPKNKVKENVAHLAKFLLHKPGFSAADRKELMMLSNGEGGLSSVLAYGEKYFKNKAIQNFENTVNKAYKKLDLGKIPDDAVKAFGDIFNKVTAESTAVKNKMQKILNSSKLPENPFVKAFGDNLKSEINSIRNLSRADIKRLTQDLDFWYKATAREIKTFESKEVLLSNKIAGKLTQAIKNIYKSELPEDKITKALSLKDKILSISSSKLETDITVMQKMFGYNSREAMDLYRYKLQSKNASLRVTNHANNVLGKLQQKLKITPKELRQTYTLKGDVEVKANTNEIMQLYLLTKDTKTREAFLKKSTLDVEGALGFEINGKQIQLTISQINKAYSNLSPRMQIFAEELFRDINKAGRKVYSNFTQKNFGKTYPLSESFFPRHSAKGIRDFSNAELEALDAVIPGSKSIDTIKLVNAQMMIDYFKYFKKRVDSSSRVFKIKGLTDAYRTYYGNLGSLVGKQKQSEVLMHIFNNELLESTVIRRLGAKGMERLQYLKDAVYDFRGTVNMMSDISKALLKGIDYARGIPLFMNLNSITNQSLSGIMAQNLHGAKAVARAATYSSKKQARIEKLLRKESAMIESRFSKYTRFGQRSRQLYVGADHVATIERLGMQPISQVDLLTIRKTSLMPAWAEGELKGLKGKELVKWVAERASYSIDMTAPTSDAWSVSAMQRAMKESPIAKALFMYTSPIFKIYNFGEIAKAGLAQGKITRGEVASTYFLTRVVMPLMYYYKGKYLSKGVTGIARTVGGKEGGFYEERELDMIDDVYGIVNASLSSNPVFSVVLNSLGYKMYQAARGRGTRKVEAVSVDKDFLNNATNAFLAIGNAVAEFFKTPEAGETPDEKERRQLYAWTDAITKSIKIGAPYPARVIKEAMPSPEKSKSAYYRMLEDAVKMKDTGRAQFAISRLVKLGEYDFVVKRNVKKKLDGKVKYNSDYLENLFR